MASTGDQGKRAGIGHRNKSQIPIEQLSQMMSKIGGSLNDYTSHCSSYKPEANLESIYLGSKVKLVCSLVISTFLNTCKS